MLLMLLKNNPSIKREDAEAMLRGRVGGKFKHQDISDAVELAIRKHYALQADGVLTYVAEADSSRATCALYEEMRCCF